MSMTETDNLNSLLATKLLTQSDKDTHSQESESKVLNCVNARESCASCSTTTSPSCTSFTSEAALSPSCEDDAANNVCDDDVKMISYACSNNILCLKEIGLLPISNTGNSVPICTTGNSVPICTTGNIVPICTTGNIVPICTTGNIVPICTTGNSVPICTTGNSVPICTTGNIVPICTTGNIVPICTTGNTVPICTTGNSVHHQEYQHAVPDYKEPVFNIILSKSSPCLQTRGDKQIGSPLSSIVNTFESLKSGSDTLLHVLSADASFYKHAYSIPCDLLTLSSFPILHNGLESAHNNDFSKNVILKVNHLISEPISKTSASLDIRDTTINSKLKIVSPGPLSVEYTTKKEGSTSNYPDKYLGVGACYFLEQEKHSETNEEDDFTEKGDQKILEKYTSMDMLHTNSQQVDENIADKFVESVQNVNRTCITQDRSISKRNISCGNLLSDCSQTSDIKLDMLLDANTFLRIHEQDFELCSYLLSTLEEMISILARNREMYNSADMEFVNDYDNQCTDCTVLFAENKNRSGNSGYSPTRKSTGTMNVRKKNKTPEPAVNVATSSQSQSLQSCLEKARLACTLQGTMGRMRNRADNVAAVKAYEQSVKDFETSMKEFLQDNSRSCVESSTLEDQQQTMDMNVSKGELEDINDEIRHNILRRSDTFIVPDPCTSKPTSRVERRNTYVSNKPECSRQETMLSLKKSGNIIDEKLFALNSLLSKNTTRASTSQEKYNSSNARGSSLNKLQSDRTKHSNQGKYSSASRLRTCSKRQQSAVVSSYLGIDHDFDSDSSDSLSMLKENGSQKHTNSNLSQARDPKSYAENKIDKENVHSNNTRSNTKIISDKSPELSKAHHLNDKKTEVHSPTGSVLGDALSCINTSPPILQATWMSLNEDSDINKVKEDEYVSDINSVNEEQKLHEKCIASISDVCLTYDCSLNESVASIDKSNKRTCKNINVICIESENMTKEKPTQNTETQEKIQDSVLSNDQKASCHSVFSCGVCDSSSLPSPQVIYSFEEALGSLGYIGAPECERAFQENPPTDLYNEKHINSRDDGSSAIPEDKSLGPSSHNSLSRDSEQPHNKWRIPTEAKKYVFPRICSDFITPKVDWYTRDEDDLDELRHDVSPSDLLKQRQKIDVEAKLQELNQYSQRIKKRKSPLRKRTSTDTPSWVEYTGSVYRSNDHNQVVGLTTNTDDGTNLSFIKPDKMHREISLVEESKTETKEIGGTCATFHEDNNVQVIVSVSQLFDVKIKEEKEVLVVEELNSPRNESLLCVANMDPNETIRCRHTMVSKDIHENCSIHVDKTHDQDKQESSPQNKCSMNCSSASTTSDEYILSLPGCVIDCSLDTDIINSKYTNKCSHLPCTNVSLKWAPCSEKNIKRELFTNSSSEIADVKKSRSEGHQSSSSNSVLVLGNVSNDTLRDHISPNIQVSPFNLNDIDENVDDDTNYPFLKNVEIEHMIREVSKTESKVRKSPYPACFVSLKEEYGPAVNRVCENDLFNKTNSRIHAQINAIQINDKHNTEHGMKTELETIKMYSMESPPKCIYSNKEEAVSHLNDLPVNQDTMYRKGEKTRIVDEMDNKETYPFSVAGNYLDSFSPSENDPSDYWQPLAKNNSKQPIVLHSSQKFKVTGGDNMVTQPCFTEDCEMKSKYKVIDSSLDLSFCGKTTSEQDDNDISMTASFIKQKADTEYSDASEPGSEETQLKKQDIDKDLLTLNESEHSGVTQNESEHRSGHGVDLKTDRDEIKELHDKVDRLERMLAQRESRNNIIQDGLTLQPNSYSHCLQCSSLQSLVQQTEMYPLTHQQQGYCINPVCCSCISDHGLDWIHSRDCVSSSPCLCTQRSCFHQPVEASRTDIIGQQTLVPSVSIACQTVQTYPSTKCLNSKAGPRNECLTQYESEMPHDRASATCKMLEQQVSIIHGDTQETKQHLLAPEIAQNRHHNPCVHHGISKADRDARMTCGQDSLQTSQYLPQSHCMDFVSRTLQIVQETLLSMQVSLSCQRREMEEIKSSTKRIASTFEDSNCDLKKKGMDYDKMKERVIELTSQRDAEKVFHRITRQSLRALERDHDRLRQEFISANCRRHKHGDGIGQNRVWYYHNNEDSSNLQNDNHGSVIETHITSEQVYQREVRREEDVSRHGKHRTGDRQHSQHRDQKTDSSHPKPSKTGSCNVTDNISVQQTSSYEFSNIKETEYKDSSKSKHEQTNKDVHNRSQHENREHVSFSNDSNKIAKPNMRARLCVESSDLDIDQLGSGLGQTSKSRSLKGTKDSQKSSMETCIKTDLSLTAASTETSLSTESCTCYDNSSTSCLYVQPVLNELKVNVTTLSECTESANLFNS